MDWWLFSLKRVVLSPELEAVVHCEYDDMVSAC